MLARALPPLLILTLSIFDLIPWKGWRLIRSCVSSCMAVSYPSLAISFGPLKEELKNLSRGEGTSEARVYAHTL